MSKEQASQQVVVTQARIPVDKSPFFGRVRAWWRGAKAWGQPKWARLINVGLPPDASGWPQKRVRLLNGITLISLSVYGLYMVAFLNSADRVTFWTAVLAFGLSCGTMLLTYHRRYEAASYYVILCNTFLYCLIPIAKKNDGSEYILITVGIMAMLLFQRFLPIALLFTLNVVAFFAVRYAQTVIVPFWYQPTSVNVHDTNLFLFILTLFIVVYIFRTENSKQEARLLGQNEQIAQSLTELHTTQTQLVQKEKMAALGELTAGIAHEIQNPLNFVNNFAELSAELLADLKAELLAAQVADADHLATTLEANLRKITHHGQRATAIVRGMLAHSRTDIGERRPMNINTLVAEYLRLAYHGFKAQSQDFNVRLVATYADDLPRVGGWPQELGRVLLNLYNNAFYAVEQRRRASPASYQPEVAVHTQRTPQGVEVRIRDNGVGIPAAIISKVYQPFFTTKPPGQGTGLGLSLSYEVVTTMHGGKLLVDTVEGEYTEFTIFLPAAHPAPAGPVNN